VERKFYGPKSPTPSSGYAHLANRSFADLAVRQLKPNPFPDPMGSVTLFSWRFSVSLQNGLHKLARSFRFHCGPLGLLRGFGKGSRRPHEHLPV
jgi:hypothetical protein